MQCIKDYQVDLNPICIFMWCDHLSIHCSLKQSQALWTCRGLVAQIQQHFYH